MNLLLTQQEIRLPIWHHSTDALERSWYSFFSGHTVTVAPNIPDYFDNVDQFDALVITGACLFALWGRSPNHYPPDY
jgi:hypothetical protein